MRRVIFFFLFFVFSIYVFANNYAVDVAESFFVGMKNREYSNIFELLTSKSKDVIISEVYNAIIKIDESVTKESLMFDFKMGGEISKSYWQGFLKNFNPDMVLVDSSWSVGKCDEKYCEVIITYKKSQKPALLKLYKENNSWKVGVVESFWARKK